MVLVAWDCAEIVQLICCAEKSIHAAKKQSASAASKAPAAAAAADGPVKARAKKVPRYVKEALQEVEQEKATKLATTQTQVPPQGDLQKPAKAAKAGKAVKQQLQKVKKPAKKGKLAK